MSTMRRVTVKTPCLICKKTDWCLFGRDVSICMRVPSARPKQFSDGSIGYLHARNGGELPKLQPKAKVPVDFSSRKTLDKWRVDYGLKSLVYLAKTLGVSVDSLEQLGCTKAPQHSVWGFPMSDGKGYVIGIRLRHENGRKWCEPGGHNGLFIPKHVPSKEIVICEGPTDTAAALTLGLCAIGRFNCCGGVNMIQEFIHDRGVRRATIIADVDDDREIGGVTVNPGIQGAIALANLLPIPTRIVTLPTKDIRAFVVGGGTLETFNAVASQIVWSHPV